jgi:hypothetical protein
MPAAATEDMSLEHRAALMSPEELAELLDGVDLEDLEYDWRWNGRPSQILPVTADEGGEDWTLALALAGRGFG